MIDPFRLSGGRRGGVLLVHGFTGSPHEMRPLADPLATAGWDVLGIRLPGHGSPEIPEPNEWSAWRAAVEEGIDRLERDGSAGRIAVVGLSMGALLAVDLATREPGRLRSVVALSPATTLPARRLAALWLARRFAPARMRGRLLPKGESDIRDDEARAAHPLSPPFPLSAVLSFDELRRRVRRDARGLSLPLLIVHSVGDRTCPVGGARWLARRVASPDVEIHLLERGGHVIPVDVERETALRLVLGFLDRTVPAAAPAG